MASHALDEKAETLTHNSTDGKASADNLEKSDNEKPLSLSRTASRASRVSRHSWAGSRPPSRPPSRAEVAEALDAGVAAEHKDSSELPNGGYGWVVVVCVLALNACTWG